MQNIQAPAHVKQTRVSATVRHMVLNQTDATQFRLIHVGQRSVNHKVEVILSRSQQRQVVLCDAEGADHIQDLVRSVVDVCFQPSGSDREPPTIKRIFGATRNLEPLEVADDSWLCDNTAKVAFAQLCSLVSHLSLAYRDLINELFRSNQTLHNFLNNPASLWHHHSFRSGLLIHSVQVAKDCLMTHQVYPELDLDLLLSAALLHDIGKCQEYAHGRSGRFQRTQEGELEMHKLQGFAMVHTAANSIHFPNEMLSRLKHCICAADGPKYMGLPNKKLAEATFVQAADSRSAAYGMFHKARPEGIATPSRAQRFGVMPRPTVNAVRHVVKLN